MNTYLKVALGLGALGGVIYLIWRVTHPPVKEVLVQVGEPTIVSESN